MLTPHKSYEEVYGSFRWQIPEFYNIGVDVSDKWASDKNRGSPQRGSSCPPNSIGTFTGVEFPHNFFPQKDDFFWTPADWAWIGGLIMVEPIISSPAPDTEYGLRKSRIA